MPARAGAKSKLQVPTCLVVQSVRLEPIDFGGKTDFTSEPGPRASLCGTPAHYGQALLVAITVSVLIIAVPYGRRSVQGSTAIPHRLIVKKVTGIEQAALRVWLFALIGQTRRGADPGHVIRRGDVSLVGHYRRTAYIEDAISVPDIASEDGTVIRYVSTGHCIARVVSVYAASVLDIA